MLRRFERFRSVVKNEDEALKPSTMGRFRHLWTLPLSPVGRYVPPICCLRVAQARGRIEIMYMIVQK
jgi:hypothetical protein